MLCKTLTYVYRKSNLELLMKKILLCARTRDKWNECLVGQNYGKFRKLEIQLKSEKTDSLEKKKGKKIY